MVRNSEGQRRPSRLFIRLVACLSFFSVSVTIAGEPNTCDTAFTLLSSLKGKEGSKAKKALTSLTAQAVKDLNRLRKSTSAPGEEAPKNAEDLVAALSLMKEQMGEKSGVRTKTISDPLEIQKVLTAFKTFPKRIAGEGYRFENYPNRALRLGVSIPILWTMGLVPLIVLGAKLGHPEIARAYLLSNPVAMLLSLPFLAQGLWRTPQYKLAEVDKDGLTFRKLGLLEPLLRGVRQEQQEGEDRGIYVGVWKDLGGLFGLILDRTSSPKLHLYVIPNAAPAFP